MYTSPTMTLNKRIRTLIDNKVTYNFAEELATEYGLNVRTVHRHVKTISGKSIRALINENREWVVKNTVENNLPLDTLMEKVSLPFFQSFTKFFINITGVHYRDAKRAQRYGVLKPFLEKKGSINELLCQRIESIIETHLTSEYLICELMAEFKCTKFTLNRLWKELNNEDTLKQYIDYRRVLLAKSVYLETGLTGPALQRRVGFKSEETLNRLFKEHYGISLKAFTRSKRIGKSFMYNGNKIHLLPSFIKEIDQVVHNVMSNLPLDLDLLAQNKLINKILTVNSVARIMEIPDDTLSEIIWALSNTTPEQFFKERYLKKDKPLCTSFIPTEVR